MADAKPIDAPTLDTPPQIVDDAPAIDDRLLSILGVHLTDVCRRRAVEILDGLVSRYRGRARTVCFVNAHTLNLACDDEDYRHALNAADYCFGDGTGVRWAARLQGIRVRANLCGTDLVPQLFRTTAERRYRCFLLGGDEPLVAAAADYVQRTFAGWTVAGRHHGYLDPAGSAEVIAQINAVRPDLVLVGMGNPRQELWLHAHRRQIEAPLALAVGGLFHYWAGDLHRAPIWLRRIGAEWLGILLQQPHKARRYLLGNPRFLWRIGREAISRRFRRRPALTP